MFSKNRRVDPLPGLGAVRVPTFGWPNVERNEYRSVWHHEGDVLSLNYFPAEPTVCGPVGDDHRLMEYFELYARAGKAAIVEARWTTSGDGMPIAWCISKARQRGSGVSYVGSLIVPFATCSWVAKLESMEGSPTGAREALWFDRHLAAGGTPEEAYPGLGAQLPEDGPPPVRRLPSDDEAWDEILPSHPLSRVRRLLPRLAASIEISPAAKRLSPFR